MLLWVILAGLTAGALAAVLWPFLRTARDAVTPSGHDAEIYRDQLGEIEADLARGLIGKGEAEAAKTEIARRLLAASDAQAREKGAGAAPRRLEPHFIAFAAALAIPVLSLTLYLARGSPNLPGQPLAARLSQPDESQRFAALVAKVEARLREHPEDGRGWDVIAPVYLKSRRYQDAADAYGRALRLLGDSTKRLIGYGEALIYANNGIVTGDAREAFEKALVRDPKLLKARFWIGMAHEQDGKMGEAAKVWRSMLAEGEQDAPWRAMVEQRLALAEKGFKADTKDEKPESDAGAPGPTAAEIEAARQMSPEERQAMIDQMVAGLAERLKKDAKDLEGWLRLVRAYTVLNRQTDARQALTSARRVFAGDDEALARLEAMEKNLGL